MQVKLIIAGLFCIICSSALRADYDAANLNKLFTDKRQRAQIDAARSGNHTGSDLQQANKVNVSGYMKRGDGKSVVWLNGKNTMDSSKIDGVKVYPDSINNKKVPVRVDGRRVYIKPGESWSDSTGKVKDNY